MLPDGGKTLVNEAPGRPCDLERSTPKKPRSRVPTKIHQHFVRYPRLLRLDPPWWLSCLALALN